MTYEEHDQISDGGGTYQSFSERRFGLSTSKFFLVSGLIAGMLFYFGVLIFGNNSILVLFHLEEYQNFLIDDIERLKKENAALQKQYFELKELDGDAQTAKRGVVVP